MKGVANQEASVAEVILALDVGQSRIGVARGEAGSSFAFGRGFVTRSKQKADVAAIQTLMTRENASLLVVGLPRRTDGKDSPQTQRVRSFARALQDAGLTVVFEDERFSTRIATEGILKSGASKKRRQDKGRVDEASAIVILESYLARTRTAQVTDAQTSTKHSG